MSPTIDSLLGEYTRHLRAEGKTPGTVDHTYLRRLRAFDAYLAAQGMPRQVGSVRDTKVATISRGITASG